MADPLTISLTGPLADYVRAAAEARGLSVEVYVNQRLWRHANPATQDLLRLHASWKAADDKSKPKAVI